MSVSVTVYLQQICLQCKATVSFHHRSGRCWAKFANQGKMNSFQFKVDHFLDFLIEKEVTLRSVPYWLRAYTVLHFVKN